MNMKIPLPKKVNIIGNKKFFLKKEIWLMGRIILNIEGVSLQQRQINSKEGDKLSGKKMKQHHGPWASATSA